VLKQWDIVDLYVNEQIIQLCAIKTDLQFSLVCFFVFIGNHQNSSNFQFSQQFFTTFQNHETISLTLLSFSIKFRTVFEYFRVFFTIFFTRHDSSRKIINDDYDGERKWVEEFSSNIVKKSRENSEKLSLTRTFSFALQFSHFPWCFCLDWWNVLLVKFINEHGKHQNIHWIHVQFPLHAGTL
jgi:hypothetical protein